MSAPSFFRRAADFEIVSLGPSDCADASILHGMGFSRPWSDGEFQALMVQETVFGFAARRPAAGKGSLPGGFVLARMVAGEAEILTITVHPKYRETGIGWRLMLAALRHLRAEGAQTLFLEVDEENRAALALYKKFGFAQVARRAAYYKHEGTANSAALVMRLDLG